MDFGPRGIDYTKTPKQLGYHFPAEWEEHEATWLSWPHKKASWPGKIDLIYPVYAQFTKLLAESEKVRINVSGERLKQFALKFITQAGTDLNNVEFYFHPTNDAWCRDHGPSFLINPAAEIKKVIVNWGFNGSDRRSFPSGHAANAFATAEFMRLEYKHKSPLYGVVAYGIAATTGAYRIYHNNHWFSDVVAGAGIGILSTNITYFVYPKIKNIVAKVVKVKASDIHVSPLYQNKR